MENIKARVITVKNIEDFKAYLRCAGRTMGTIEQYVRHISEFTQWFALLNENEAECEINEEFIYEWKRYLCEEGCAAATVNVKLAAINAFCRFMRWNIKASLLKVQRRMFREPQKELTRAEYIRLVDAARIGKKQRLMLLMETICSTGIRVSEIKYITVESIDAGFAEVALKGKIRTIFIPKKLCRKLKKYAKNQKILKGEIFLTKNGKTISRHQIWAELKGLCELAGVERSKVFPHNLRHLFAEVFYKNSHDIVKLADVLGHSSIETTRIYLVTSGTEHRKQLERLRLVS